MPSSICEILVVDEIDSVVNCSIASDVTLSIAGENSENGVVVIGSDVLDSVDNVSALDVVLGAGVVIDITGFFVDGIFVVRGNAVVVLAGFGGLFTVVLDGVNSSTVVYVTLILGASIGLYVVTLIGPAVDGDGNEMVEENFGGVAALVVVVVVISGVVVPSVDISICVVFNFEIVVP